MIEKLLRIWVDNDSTVQLFSQGRSKTRIKRWYTRIKFRTRRSKLKSKFQLQWELKLCPTRCLLYLTPSNCKRSLLFTSTACIMLHESIYKTITLFMYRKDYFYPNILYQYISYSCSYSTQICFSCG